MAATWIKPLRMHKGQTRSSVVANIIGYVKNPSKTDGGKLIVAYACDSRTADLEFMLSKKMYEHTTGRNQGWREVLAYHIRQSFKPDEVDAEMASKLGYELAKSFTKGQHAFVVATHIDRKHIHNHIIFNSTNIQSDRKFNNYKDSAKAIRRISDLLCLQNGLSVIENPKSSKGQHYGKWLGEKTPSWQDKLRQKIDEVLPHCTNFEMFLTAMKAAGYVVNDKRKHLTFCAPGQQRPTRLNTLKGDHTEAAILERLAGVRIVATSSGSGMLLQATPSLPHHDNATHTHVSLLIDIQEKIRVGKGAGYEKWARLFNLKEAAKTLLFLQENGIDSYDVLVKRASDASGDFAELSGKIKGIDKRLQEITELQKQIGTYRKTRDTYGAYKASGWDKDFYESQRKDITLHRAAKEYFNALGIKKLPTIAMLKQEYAGLLAEKKKLYVGYRDARANMQKLLIAKDNTTKILGIAPDSLERTAPSQSQPSKELEI